MTKSEWPTEWSAHYPQRKCREAVWNDLIAHTCDLAVDSLGMDHAGPCASQAVPASIQRRKNYLEDKENN